jgi:N-acetylglucosaminyldiphosphoundecaprenol N-acetyl-beta-D-mannosaminyltransferase
MRKSVLGTPVDVLSKAETVKKISSWIEKEGDMKLVVTAYSEFYVRADRDNDFLQVMNSADLVTPDGVSVLAAVKYLERVKGKLLPGRLYGGLKVGGEILTGQVGETVTGVWLFEELTKLAAEKDWKVFLLGGWDNVSGRAARKLLKRFPKIKVTYDAGEEKVGTDEKKNREVIEKINKFQPDILFVAYNPIKQEKWLAKYRHELKAKVGIGVGGTYNEYVGELKLAPEWMQRMGLKWLWRVVIEPKRIGRILKAVIVFPWLVFKQS